MKKVTKRKITKNKVNKLLTGLFYGLIGAVSFLGLFLLFYWSLRLNASIDNLIRNFYGVPLYFWPYVILTVGTLVLFGINVPLLVYRWRKYGFSKLRRQAGGGLGAVIGVLASACPVCGSTLLSAIGVAGGLAAFPLAGLELKALSFGLMLVPFWLTTNELKLFAKGGKECPIPKDPSFKRSEWPILAFLIFQTVVFSTVSWTMLKTDPAVARVLSNNLINPNDNKLYTLTNSKTGNKIYDEVVAKILPEKGFQSKISLNDSVVKLVQNGVIDEQKFEALYQENGSLPDELKDVLIISSDKPILLSRENAKLDMVEPKGNDMGVITSISGETEVLLPDGTLIELSKEVKNGTISLPYGLPEKTQIFTGDETIVRIGLGGGVRIAVDALSEFTLDEFNIERSLAQPSFMTRMRLKTGKVDVDIQKGEFTSDMKIATPANTGAVTGTHFAVAYGGRTGISIFEIYDGTIKVTNDKTNKTISLTSSYDKPIKRVEIGKDNEFVYKTAIAGNEWRKRQALWVFVAISLTFIVIFGLYGRRLTKNKFSFMISLMKTNFNVGIIVVLVIGLLLGYVVYPFFNPSNIQTDKSKGFKELTKTDWATFEDEQYGISFDYPSSWNIDKTSQVFENGDIIMVQFTGDTQQPNTEFYDGARFILMTPVPTDLDLDSWVNSKYSANDQISDVSINGVVFKKVYTCGLICSTYYYAVLNGNVYGVNTFAEGSQKTELEKDLSEMLSTLVLPK